MRTLRQSPEPARLAPGDWHWFALAVAFGGVMGPVLLMYSLVRMPASGAALLLNAESVFTAVIAWVVFRENVDRRVFLGMLAIVAGAVFLSWPERADFGAMLPALAVLGACLCWGIDNNLTRKVSLATPAEARRERTGLGRTNSCSLLHSRWVATGVGRRRTRRVFLAYGVSLFVVFALRHLYAPPAPTSVLHRSLRAFGHWRVGWPLTLH